MKRIYYFTASWCPPCKQTRPIVDEINKEFGRDIFEIIDIDSSTELIKQYGINSIPTFVMVDEIGNEVNRIFGGKNRSQLEEFING
jgi:thioredoxin 1